MQLLGFDFSIKKKALSVVPNITDALLQENAGSKQQVNPSVIQIAASFKDRSRKDIDKWRLALSATQFMTNPKFYFYYDLLDDLLTDGHLQSQIQMRKLSTLNTDYRVIDFETGEEDPELNFLFNQQWFYDFVEACLDSILFGTTIIEFQTFQNEKIEFSVIPRRNVVPTLGLVFPDVTKLEAVNYRNPDYAPWLLQIGKDYDLGLLNNIVPNLIWKRNVAQSWAEFCERFGLPLITATTNSTDSNVIDKVHQMLLNLGEASVGTFPPGTDIRFQEANRTDAFNVYQKFMESNAQEISKQLVGSTMLSDQGANRAQTEVHERSLDNRIAQADKRLIQFIVNDQLLPILRMHGYRIDSKQVFEFKTAEQEIELPQLWNITSGLLVNGFNVDPEWISKTFNIPIEGERRIAPVLSPFQAELKPAVTALLGSEASKKKDRYEGLKCDCGHHHLPIDQMSSDELKKFTDQLTQYIFEGKDTLGIEAQTISKEAQILLEGLHSSFKTFNPWVGPDHLMLQMMEYNLFDFATSKTESRLAAMKELLFDENKQLRDFPSFRVKVDKVMDKYNKNYLETEYNLSVAVGQNSSQYVEFKAEEDTVTQYVRYQTAGDSRVRASHEVLNGRIFDLKDKDGLSIWPPNGFGCRCEMIQYLGDGKNNVTSNNDAKALLYAHDGKYKGSQFEVNRGDLKQVFTNKQFYSDIKKLPERINDYTYDKYQDLQGKPLLQSWDDFKAGLKDLVLDPSINSKNVKELFKVANPTEKNEYMGFTDYLGRKMTLNEKIFTKHTTEEKYLKSGENRPQLFPHIKEVVENPDEVWYHKMAKDGDKQIDQKPYQSRYIKFYGNEVLIVDCSLDAKQGLKINTWYLMKTDEKTIRKGLKIK